VSSSVGLPGNEIASAATSETVFLKGVISCDVCKKSFGDRRTLGGGILCAFHTL
jgi:hypothetical protein